MGEHLWFNVCRYFPGIGDYNNSRLHFSVIYSYVGIKNYVVTLVQCVMMQFVITINS